VKIPIFRSTDDRESFERLRTLCQCRQVFLNDAEFDEVKEILLLLLTPKAAEALAVKIYRTVRTENMTHLEALRSSLVDYQNPIPLEVLQIQIDLAVHESTDLEFVPLKFRTRQIPN